MSHKTENKQTIITLSVVIICLLLSLYFPASSPFQKITRSVFFLLVIPVFYIKTVLKKNLSDFGFNLKNKASGIFWIITLILVSTLVSFCLLWYTEVNSYYKLPEYLSENFWLFLIYEVFFTNLFLLTASFFYKGFLLFTLAPRFSYWSIILTAIIRFLVLLSAGGHPAILASSFLISLAESSSAYKTKSFFYSYFASFIFSVIFDAYLIYTLKQN